MPADLMRVDACPRCQRNLPSDPSPDEDRTDCPVCCGKPVLCIVLWRVPVDNARRGLAGGEEANRALTPTLSLMRDASTAAMEISTRSDALCGPLVHVEKTKEPKP